MLSDYNRQWRFVRFEIFFVINPANRWRIKGAVQSIDFFQENHVQCGL